MSTLQAPTPAATPAATFLSVAPRDLQAWARHFDAAALPVLGETAESIEQWRANEDAADAHGLAQVITADPLMTLKLLAHVGTLRHGRSGTDAETVTEALVMLGITPFFRAFGPQPTVEQRLAGRPEALEGFRAVLRRSHRAANFAIGFAVQRLDHDGPVIHEAALLHDFAELLLWLHAPDLALDIARRQHADATLRSADVQAAVLHIQLPELQHLLMQRWHLPQLLIAISDDQRHNHSAQVRNVLLAIRVARHSAHGWDNAALPDDLREIAELLHMGIEPARKLLIEIDG